MSGQPTQLFNIDTCHMTNNIAPASGALLQPPPQDNNDCREYLENLFTSANINHSQKKTVEERMANILRITEDYPNLDLFQICSNTVKRKKWGYMKKVFRATFDAVLPAVRAKAQPQPPPEMSSTVRVPTPILPPTVYPIAAPPVMQSYHPYRRTNVRSTEILMEGHMSHCLLQRTITDGQEEWSGFWQRYGGPSGKESKHEKHIFSGRLMINITCNNKISIRNGGLVVDIIVTKTELERVQHFLDRHEILSVPIWIA